MCVYEVSINQLSHLHLRFVFSMKRAIAENTHKSVVKGIR